MLARTCSAVHSKLVPAQTKDSHGGGHAFGAAVARGGGGRGARAAAAGAAKLEARGHGGGHRQGDQSTALLGGLPQWRCAKFGRCCCWPRYLHTHTPPCIKKHTLYIGSDCGSFCCYNKLASRSVVLYIGRVNTARGGEQETIV